MKSTLQQTDDLFGCLVQKFTFVIVALLPLCSFNANLFFFLIPVFLSYRNFLFRQGFSVHLWYEEFKLCTEVLIRRAPPFC